MNSIKYKSIELFIIFILVPVTYAINYSTWIKLGIGLFGFIYVIYVLLKVEHETFRIAPNLNWKLFWKETFIKGIIIAIVTTVLVWITDSASLFNVLIDNPIKWLILVFIYSLFSVYPQELLFRTFFFKRYYSLFKSDVFFIFVNAILFALAHLFFGSLLVLIITFIGGLLFAYTFKYTRSTLLVSIEHAIYGSWLFTVGMGAMLGFPV